LFTATATDLKGNTSEFSECAAMFNPFCGDPDLSGQIVAGDALLALNAAVGLVSCSDCLCDVTGNGTITTADAYAILRFSVGQTVTLECPPCS
jgi:hypothetical protein